ncbi:MAG TPA: regulatory protein RecX [Vicinamibacterales bacterium]|nr:regulatory protein RecX [Vicinamibacterales bacterium]
MADSAYLTALKQLARRELSEAQLRQRLTRRKFSPDDIDTTIARLLQDGSLDDARTAAAIARSQLSLKKRGQRRVRREIEAAGIASALAERAVADVYAEVDGEALLAAAIDRRLGTRRLDDDREMARLYRYLVGQGFDSERAMAALRKRRKSSS